MILDRTPVRVDCANEGASNESQAGVIEVLAAEIVDHHRHAWRAHERIELPALEERLAAGFEPGHRKAVMGWIGAQLAARQMVDEIGRSAQAVFGSIVVAVVLGASGVLPGTSRLLPKGGRINLTVRRVTPPA